MNRVQTLQPRVQGNARGEPRRGRVPTHRTTIRHSTVGRSRGGCATAQRAYELCKQNFFESFAELFRSNFENSKETSNFKRIKTVVQVFQFWNGFVLWREHGELWKPEPRWKVCGHVRGWTGPRAGPRPQGAAEPAHAGAVARAPHRLLPARADWYSAIYAESRHYLDVRGKFHNLGTSYS